MNLIIRFALTSLVCATLAVLAGCDPKKPKAQNASVAQLIGDAAPAADANKPVADTTAAPAYTPPTAAQLISLLAPVAVFPDKLIAQVLAASSYPDQITEANRWLAQNSQLKGDALQQAIDRQDWDPSVKAIVVFPDVLHQMANNIPWTSALGDAYVNDPNDVMNAIQALRAQALACDKLKSDDRITVTKTARNVAPPTTQYADEPAVYEGPPVIAPPEEIIEIEPAQPEYVYVPYFDPAVYYGTPVDAWPGYYYAWPTPGYYGPVFAFSFGIWIGGHRHRDWGWDRWNVNWGRGFDRHWGGRSWRDSAVVYNDRPYVSRSTTVVNRFANPTVRAAVDPARATAAITNTAFARRTAPTDFSRISPPQFTAAMAQRSAATTMPMRANFTQTTTAFTNPRTNALAPNSYASPTVSRAAQNFDRTAALPSSRYAPAPPRSTYSGGMRANTFTARDTVRMPASGYAPATRQAYAGNGYRAQSVQRSYVSAPRSYVPRPAMRGPVPSPVNRPYASAPRMQAAPHYSAPRSAPANSGGRDNRH